MSLYRTYRPQGFADVVGQDAVVTTLEQAAKQKKLSHAFLFAGSRGTGKTSVARILAKILMTKDIEDETLQKQIIKGVEEGSVVDLLEIDAASNRGIDDVRDLIEKIQFSPVVASAKVYIIDEVHMLTKEAFNALLKTLEEPPDYAYFILATTELNKIPATIQSRCQCFPFRAVPEEDIIRRLQFIADQERIEVERDALRVIAHHVQGGMRDAISMLDQLRSLPKITREDVEQRMGKTGEEHVEAIFKAIDNHDPAEIIASVQKIEEEGIALDVFLRTLLGTVRTMLHEAIRKKQSTMQLRDILDELLKAVRDIRTAPVPGVVLESTLLSLAAEPTERKEKSSKLADSMEEKLKEKGKKEKEQKKEKSSKDIEEDTKEEEEKEETKDEEASIKKASVEAAELTMESLQNVWPQIIQETTPASVRMSLKNGKIIALDEKSLTIGFSSSFHKEKVAHPEASRTIAEVMERIFKRSMRIECVIGGKIEEDSVASEPQVDLAEAAAEIF